jgi:tyrosyl-tRNA synthetase
MRFFLGDDLLDRAPSYMVALVVARFNAPPEAAGRAWAEGLLRDAVAALPAALAPSDPGASPLRDDPRVAVWRAAFTSLGLNPNRYPSSIEALAGRALKGGAIPSATTLVDLANAVALRHLVPAGAHDLDTLSGDLGVRLSRAGDTFATGGQVESLPPGEPVYAAGSEVRTRRWVWRQADNGRLTPQSARILFPIDGFRGQTDAAVLAAAQSLMDHLATLGPAELALYRVDAECRSVDLSRPTAPGPDIRALPVTQDLRATLTRMTDSARARGAAPPAEEKMAMTVEPVPAAPAPAVRVDEEGIREALERGVEIVEVRADLERALRSGRRLRVKLGIDPTGPRIHIGRAVTLRKMRQFQRLGHQAVLIVGDLTAQIGDASDKNEERPMLTAEQVRENMRNYAQQIGMIVDLDRAEFEYNSTWLDALSFKDVIALAKNFTAAQMIQRENFRNRWEAGERIGLQELLYPLMQGYDSLAIKADVELGGTDQLFNVMAGRKVQEAYGQKPQNIVLISMVMGLDGRKMSTSWGNTIFINDAPVDQYGKMMSAGDEMIGPYLESCTDLPIAEVRRLQADLVSGHAHPKEMKKLLAWQIVKEYHGEDAANFAQAEFEKVFEQRGAPSEVPGVSVPAAEVRLVDLLVTTGQAPSKAQARRVIEQGGVEIDDQRVSDANAAVLPRDGMLIKFGRRSFVRLQVS